jgi:hypothetical protein
MLCFYYAIVKCMYAKTEKRKKDLVAMEALSNTLSASEIMSYTLNLEMIYDSDCGLWLSPIWVLL